MIIKAEIHYTLKITMLKKKDYKVFIINNQTTTAIFP